MVYPRISCKSARKERLRMGERKEKGWEKERAGREGRKAKERGLNLSLCSFKILSPPLFATHQIHASVLRPMARMLR